MSGNGSGDAAQIEKQTEDDLPDPGDSAEPTEESSNTAESELPPSGGPEKPVHDGEEKPLIAEKVTSSDVQVTPSQHESLEGDVKNAENVSINEEIVKVDTLIQELTDSYSLLKEATRESFAALQQLLKQREVELLASYEANFDHKLSLLNDFKEKVLASSDPQAPKTPLPSLAGGTCCGFVPDMTSLVHSTACLMLEHRKEVEEGQEMSVSVIGSLSNEGRFWVRILPDDSGLQDVMLQNLSNTIGVELSLSTFTSLKSANVGDVCCALYSEDQRWYRGRIVEVMKERKKAKVYFLDYGNTEIISYSSLCKLPPKFLVYPFQMIQCCFSNDDTLTYEREARWKFTDMTHGSELTVRILQNLPDNLLGKLHLVQLTNCSGAQPFDVGKSIVLMAGSVPTKPSPIKYHDIRYPRKNASSSCGHLQTLSSNPPAKQSQATPSPPPPAIEATPPPTTIEEGGTTKETSSETPSEVPCSSSEQSVLCDSHSTTHSNSTSSFNTAPTSSADTITTASPQDQAHDSTPLPAEEASEEEIGNENVARPDLTNQQHSPPIGDVAGVIRGVAGSSQTGNDVIASAAQIKVMEPLESAGSHSPTPARSGSPVPIPVTGDETVEISTRVKSETVLSVPASTSFTLKQGDEREVYVTTPLSSDGCFWVQLSSTEQPEFKTMVEELQRCCGEELPTPVFFSPGDVCAAQFSEDNCWYRACVEEVVGNKFLVRYLDFGNSETRGSEYLMVLRSEFRTIPFQSFHCSIACTDHTSFSKKEIERFEKVTESKKITAKILSVEGALAHVQLLLTLSDDTIDLNEEIYTSDVTIGESMNFSLQDVTEVKQERSVPASDQAAPTLALSAVKDGPPSQSSSWADFMDDIQSPKNDGIFTLAGQSSRSQSPTPFTSPQPRPQQSPSPQPHPRSQRSTPPPPRSNSHTPTSRESQERLIARSTSPRNRTPISQNGPVGRSGPTLATPPNGGVSRSGSAPRINTLALGNLRKELLIAEKGSFHGRKERAKSDQPNLHHQTDTKTNEDSTFSHSPSLPPGLPQPKGIRSINQVSRNGTAFPPTGRRRKSPEPEASQVKLFVRYMPHNKTMEDVYHLFGLYGHIHMLEYHTEHKDKLYLIMDREGGRRAIEGLNGNQLSGSPKPLSVQPYKVTTAQSPEQTDLDNLPNAISTRLFVKNVPLNRSMEELKSMFSQFGKVHGVVPVASRKNVVYMYMDPTGASNAIEQLYGKAVAKHSKPLIVEVSQPPKKTRS